MKENENLKQKKIIEGLFPMFNEHCLFTSIFFPLKLGQYLKSLMYANELY